MERTIDTAKFIADVHGAQVIRVYRSHHYHPQVVTLDISNGQKRFHMNIEQAMHFYEELSNALKEAWEMTLLE